ncbi:MAG: FAD-dependent oxidoreductase, partial [Desulfobacteraceae bacterium]
MAGNVLIVGGGITGIMTALTLNDLNIKTVIVEKDSKPGGKVRNYANIFPTFSSGRDMVTRLLESLYATSDITLRTNTQLTKVVRENGNFQATLTDNQVLTIDAIILANGFEPFDPLKQPEYGYGVYPNVVTALQLENMLDPKGPTKGKILRPSDGGPAKKIAIIFCVGSRNKRLGAPYCSRVCCSYSTKQAIEIMKMNRHAGVTCFYMDIRTYGKKFEEMYQHAQQLG